jgi:hypothetical protein
MSNEGITILGKTDFRNQNQSFGIKDTDRFGHVYCIGKTGTGKSTLLLNMAISDIQKGNGICIIDPHTDLSETILHYIPKERIRDVVYFNPKDQQYPIGFNPLYAVHPGYHHLVVSGLLGTFKKVWSESWGPRLEYILRFSLHTLLEYPQATLLDIQPLLTENEFRNTVLSYTDNIHIHKFWHNEFNSYSPAFKAEVIAPILNKVGIFSTSSLLRNIIGNRTKSIDTRTLMNEKKIIIANLSKGEIGEDIASLLGSMLLHSIQLSALSRASVPEEERVPFYVYVDEVASFASVAFADILSEARKYKVSLFMAHQYLGQLNEKVYNAVIGNVGTIICFRIGSEDAQILVNEFKPLFESSDLISLKRYHLYIKLMIDGATSKPFSAITHPIPQAAKSYKNEVVQYSREMYGYGIKGSQ